MTRPSKTTKLYTDTIELAKQIAKREERNFKATVDRAVRKYTEE